MAKPGRSDVRPNAMETRVLLLLAASRKVTPIQMAGALLSPATTFREDVSMRKAETITKDWCRRLLAWGLIRENRFVTGTLASYEVKEAGRRFLRVSEIGGGHG